VHGFDLMPENLINNPEFVQNGKMTPKGIAELKSKIPYLDLSTFEADPDVGKLMDLFTVDNLVASREGAYSTASDRLFQQHPTGCSRGIRPAGGLRQDLHR